MVITVQERATITQIDISGNKAIATDKMKEGLKSIGLSEGQIFDKSRLEYAEQEIKRQYLSQGKYGATVRTVVTPLERNRMALRFEITEGAVAKIHNITIVGNKAFRTEELNSQFLLTTSNWLSWWNNDDQYTKQKLNADLEKLRSFYLNRGYLDFAINSTQVSITPDKRDIYITINITEGERYVVSEVRLAGDTVVPHKEIIPLITFKAGEIFNREKITQTTKAINDRLSNEGYAFSNVNAAPEINKAKRTVAFTLLVDPGKRIYIRRININGNLVTHDEVIRRELRQLEAGWYASNKLSRSKERLIRTQYFSDVNIETPTVANTTDQVDVNLSVTEQPTGSIQFGAGLSSFEGVVIGVTVSQNNFLGTGNRVVAQVNTGKVNTVYSLSYTDPYFTPDGISRTTDIYRRDLNTSTLSVANYQTSSYGGALRFGIPLNEKDTFSIGGGIDFTDVTLSNTSPIQYIAFCGNLSGCSSNSATLSSGWTHDSRDSILFPSNGVLQRLSGEISMPVLDLRYYKAEYQQTWFYEFLPSMVISLNGEIGYANTYGNQEYPFFKGFFMGGVNSVRGYAPGSLGPIGVDANTGSQYALGGTKRLLGNLEMYFPVPGVSSSKQFRLSTFFDAGNIFSSGQTYNLSELRYSTGVGATWVSPFGPLKLVLAKALNQTTTDRTEFLQFQFGQQF